MDAKILAQGFGFATYPSVKLMGYEKNKKGEYKFGFLKELLFGDYLRPQKYKDSGKIIRRVINGKNYIRVRARGKFGYVLAHQMQPNRVMEINFVDIGQGDGCHIVTPDDEHYIIDAGKSDNMFRFLNWRFNLRKGNIKPPKFTAIITHCDEDHYGGFTKLFTHQDKFKQLLKFDAVLHNGMIEESGKPYSTLGTIATDSKGEEYVTDLCRTDASCKKRIANAKKPGRYISLLKKADASVKSLKFGDAPIYNKKGAKIEVLGPVVQKINNKDALPILKKNKGKTKNGHSVILKLTIGNLRLLLGGDLNSASEEYLFKCFTNTDIKQLKAKIADPKTKKADVKKASDKIEQAIIKLRKDFEVDIAKSCHHGSPDFTNEFMQAVNPIATIISSGDEESHCHPRPETLGAIGKFGRGNRPLIFSTELARSAKEFMDTSNLSTYKKKERLVTVYGMINVRTDGDKTIIAQKLEKPRSSNNWDINKLVWNKSENKYEYIS
jgi:beta-lactamase superfamily II metal-dependent hydrolase